MLLLDKKFSLENYSVRLQAEIEDDGLRLDQFAQNFLASFSRQEVKKRIKAKEIFIENRPESNKASSKIQEKDIVHINIPRSAQEDEHWRGQKIELKFEPDIIYQDQKLLVISKPPYMSTHPTGKHIFNCATVFFEAQTQKTVHSIHRLDRETSGVLLLAKDPLCAQEMTQHFECDRVKKAYFFIAKDLGLQTNTHFQANERLGPKEEGLKRIHIHAFPESSNKGKHARTDFSILHKENGYVLGLAYPNTGRQHQIRVHAMTHHLPLIGDKIYYGSFKMFQRFKDGLAYEEDFDLMELSRHALHSIALSIPYNNQRTLFRSQLPSDFTDWINEKMDIKLNDLEARIETDLKAYLSQVSSKE